MSDMPGLRWPNVHDLSNIDSISSTAKWVSNAIGILVVGGGTLFLAASCSHDPAHAETKQTVTQVGSVSDAPAVTWPDQVTPPAVLTRAEAVRMVAAQSCDWDQFTKRAHLPDQDTYDRNIIRVWLPK